MMERRKEIMERREVMEEYEDEYSEGVSKKEYLEMVKKRLSLIGRWVVNAKRKIIFFTFKLFQKYEKRLFIIKMNLFII